MNLITIEYNGLYFVGVQGLKQKMVICQETT